MHAEWKTARPSMRTSQFMTDLENTVTIFLSLKQNSHHTYGTVGSCLGELAKRRARRRSL
jgi:hypothetical protein